MKSELYNQIRSWAAAKQLNDVDAQFRKMVEEVGELDETLGEHRPRDPYCDAIGDSTVTCITLDRAIRLRLMDHWGLDKFSQTGILELEDNTIFGQRPITRLMSVVGRIAHNINKPGRELDALQNIALLHSMLRADAERANVRFIEDCFAPVVKIVLGRTGKIVNGTFVKAEDLSALAGHLAGRQVLGILPTVGIAVESAARGILERHQTHSGPPCHHPDCPQEAANHE